jgi:hypothetical protein
VKFKDILYDLILEAAPEEIYQKYYSDIERPLFIRVISLDPATKIEGEDNIKRIGKYSKLLIKMFKEGNLKTEDFPKVKDYLTLVYKHNVAVDINKVKTLGDLFTLVEKYYSRESGKSVFDLINVLDENEYELLSSGDKWIIYVPKSEKGAAYLGTGTEWCTAWGPYSTTDSYKERKNHFTSHNNKGSLYVMINREDPTLKYQFHFETKQFMDKNDRQVNTADFFEKNIGITKFFYPSLFDEDRSVSGEEVERMGFLNGDMTAKLIQKSIGESDNPIVNILVNMDGDELIENLRKYITDETLNDLDYDYNSKTLEFTFNEGEISNDSDLWQVHETQSQYSYDSDPYSDHSEQLRYDITERGDDDWEREIIEELLKSFWDNENVTWAKDYETFKELMFDYHEGILEDYADEYAGLNEGSVTTAAETEFNNIARFIDVTSEESIYIPPSQLALFINHENVTELSDLISFFSAYVNFHNLVYDYENPMWNMNLEYPEYRDMKTHLEGYSEKIEKELSETPECGSKREELIKIKKQYFNGGNYFSKDDLRMEIKGGYDCENGVPIVVNYLTKTNPEVSNWVRWSGHLSLERIVEYITNERLLENRKK